jgi:predicted enzyme related to lactoylglutathione lyase
MARVTGIGGVFLKARDPKALSAWYAKHLGMKLSDYGGATFEWTDEVPEGTGTTAWSLFKDDSDYFGSSGQRAMINYRVDDLDGMLAQLKEAGVWIDPKQDDYDFGRFAWIQDPEGNRVELWEPLVEKETRVAEFLG